MPSQVKKRSGDNAAPTPLAVPRKASCTLIREPILCLASQNL